MRRLIHGSRWFSSNDGLDRNERNTIEDPDESNLLQQQAAKRGVFTGDSTTTSSKGNRSVEEDYIWVVSASRNGIWFEKRHSYPATDENSKNNTNNSQHNYTRGGKRMRDFAATPSLTKLLVAVIVVLTLYCVVSIVDEGRLLEVGERTDNRQHHEQQDDRLMRRDSDHRDSNSSNPATVNAAAAASIDPIDIWLRSPAFEAKQFAPSWTPKNEEGRRANHPSSSSSSSNAEAPHSAEDSVPLSSSSSVLIPLVFTNPTRWYLRAPATFGGGDDTELLENTPLPTFGVGDEEVGVAVSLPEEIPSNSTATTVEHTLLTTDDELGVAATQHNNNNIMNEEEREQPLQGLLIVFPPKVAERPFFPYTLDRINEGRHAIFSQLADMALRYYDAPALLEAYGSVATNQKRLGSQRREERRRRNDLRGHDDDACAAVLVNEIVGHVAEDAAAAAGREEHSNGKKRFCRDRQHQLPIEELRGDEDELPLPHRW